MQDLSHWHSVPLLLLSLNAATPETHYTVIVSLDGFRWDYPDMYKTPNLDRMAADGVKAVMLPPILPLRFPITIRWPQDWFRPSRHNQQYFLGCKEQTPVFYGRLRHPQQPGILLGEPIWITAQKQGVKPAICTG